MPEEDILGLGEIERRLAAPAPRGFGGATLSSRQRLQQSGNLLNAANEAIQFRDRLTRFASGQMDFRDRMESRIQGAAATQELSRLDPGSETFRQDAISILSSSPKALQDRSVQGLLGLQENQARAAERRREDEAYRDSRMEQQQISHENAVQMKMIARDEDIEDAIRKLTPFGQKKVAERFKKNGGDLFDALMHGEQWDKHRERAEKAAEKGIIQGEDGFIDPILYAESLGTREAEKMASEARREEIEFLSKELEREKRSEEPDQQLVNGLKSRLSELWKLEDMPSRGGADDQPDDVAPAQEQPAAAPQTAEEKARAFLNLSP